MGAGRPPIKGSGTIRPRPPVLPLSRSPGIGGSLIGSAIKAKDEQRNAADGAFRNNDINKRKKAPPKSPRGPIKGSVKEPIRGPGRGFEPLPEPEPRMRDQVEWEVPNTIANRKPNFRDILPRIPEQRDPGREPELPGRKPNFRDILPRIPEQRDPGRGPIQRPGRDMTGIADTKPWLKDPSWQPEPDENGVRVWPKGSNPDFVRKNLEKGPSLDDWWYLNNPDQVGKPRFPEGPIQRPGKDMTGIMPIPDKFKDPDGNPYKQPGREPKDLQRQAVEDRMRKSKAQSKGGRKVNNAGGRW